LDESCGEVRLNDIETYAWLRDVLTKTVEGHPMQRLDRTESRRIVIEFLVEPRLLKNSATTMECQTIKLASMVI
jgi:hypothetical protein